MARILSLRLAQTLAQESQPCGQGPSRNPISNTARPGFTGAGACPGAALRLGRRPAPEKSFLLFPRRTHLPVEAKTLALRLTLLSDIAFAAWTERTLAIAPDIIERLLTELLFIVLFAGALMAAVSKFVGV